MCMRDQSAGAGEKPLCMYRQACWERCPGGWERWGEDHRGWRGALKAGKEGVDDLCVSVLATWELCLPAPDRKRNFWKCI